jgi:trehalose 6-phosphate phosphatase
MQQTTHAPGTAGTAPDPRTLCATRTGLFLDVDGTLTDFAAMPDAVRIDDAMLETLARLHTLLGGAIALISGRSIGQLDSLFQPLRLPAAGIHGFERRNANGIVFRPTGGADVLVPVRSKLRTLVADHEGLLLEEKDHAIALHFRGAPQASAIALALLESAATDLGDAYEIIEGSMVYELKPSGWNKATAISGFMHEPPFAGCVPVFLGDDLTDFDGFAAVRGHGGFDVAVGYRVSARWHLSDPGAVHAWLSQLARCLAGST